MKALWREHHSSASETFLAFNGFTLNARDAEAVVANAADELAEEERAGWFRQHLEHA